VTSIFTSHHFASYSSRIGLHSAPKEASAFNCIKILILPPCRPVSSKSIAAAPAFYLPPCFPCAKPASQWPKLLQFVGALWVRKILSRALSSTKSMKLTVPSRSHWRHSPHLHQRPPHRPLHPRCPRHQAHRHRHGIFLFQVLRRKVHLRGHHTHAVLSVMHRIRFLCRTRQRP
jgi:hypothetical protein